MERSETDILIAGGGLAGLIAAAAFAADGRRVTVVEPSPPPPDAAGPEADLRSTAFLEPSIAFLEEAGLWPVMAPAATDLAVMRLLDAGGRENIVRTRADFRAADIGQRRFGANVPNGALRHALATRLETRAHVTLRHGVGVRDLLARDDAALATLSDGTQVRAALVVAADGRESPRRRAAGIGVRRWGFGQKALTFAVSHAAPHENVSTEIHRTGGPFTLVPLPDRGGRPHSAVVWMERGPEAGRLAGLDTDAFEAALNARACGVLGPLRLASRIALWPIVNQIADRLTAPRLALVAEAAHVMPPIGAQGLNTSIADIRTLRDLLRRAGAGDLGAPELLAAYERARHGEVAARVAGVDALNRAALAGAAPVRELRNLGLRLLDGTPLRRVAMQAGLGDGPLLPVPPLRGAADVPAR